MEGLASSRPGHQSVKTSKNSRVAAATSLRPDMVLWCLPAKTERMEEALERKKGEVRRACCNTHGSRMEDTHLPCGSRTQRLCWKIEDPRSRRIRATEGSRGPRRSHQLSDEGPDMSHDDCKEATSLVKQDGIKRKMRKTLVAWPQHVA